MAHPSGDGSNSNRRRFFGQLAGATAVLGTAALPEALHALTPSTPADADHWLDKLKGKYKQVFDVFGADDGFGLAYAATFLNTQGPSPDAGAVVVNPGVL